jgi:hypothetical protein
MPLTALANDITPGTSVSAPFALEASFYNFKAFGPSAPQPTPALPTITTTGSVLILTPWLSAQGPAEEAAKKAEKGSVQKGAEFVGKIADSVSKVTSLGGLTDVVRWGAAAVGGIAGFFGLSKPLSLAANQPVFRSYFPESASLHGVSASHNLSTSDEEYVSNEPALVSSHMDELDLKYVATRESYLATITATSATTPMQLLATFPATPAFWSATAGGTAVLPAHLGFVATFFHLWRGSIKYRFMIPGSTLRKARYIVSYSPTQLITWNPDVPNQIIDVEGSASLEIVAPFLAPTPYLPCPRPSANSNVFNSAACYVQLWCMSPPAVDSDIHVWKSGCEDLQFVGLNSSVVANYTASHVTPTLDVVKRIRSSRFYVPPTNKSAQGAILGGTSIKLEGLNAESDIVSFREICKRYAPALMLGYSNLETDLHFMPFRLNVGTNSPAASSVLADVLAVIKSKYLFTRGSEEYKMVIPQTLGACFVSRSDGTDLYFESTLNNLIEFAVPYQSVATFDPNPSYFATFGDAARTYCTYPINTDGTWGIWIGFPPHADTLELTLLRACGDDFSAGRLYASPFYVL